MKNILLIVDDMPDVARALCQCLTDAFDLVVVASSPSEAERMLNDRDNPPTHLVCDHHLGDDAPLGADLIPKWRREFPSLRVAVLFTASEVEGLAATDGIDWVASKHRDIWDLVQFLLHGGATVAVPG